jgi:hypothetical protein
MAGRMRVPAAEELLRGAKQEVTAEAADGGPGRLRAVPDVPPSVPRRSSGRERHEEM